MAVWDPAAAWQEAIALTPSLNLAREHRLTGWNLHCDGCAAYPAINVLVDEWLYGIQLLHGRTPPLRDLEHAAILQPATSYRWGAPLAKAVQLRKAIIYDVLRRASALSPSAPLTDITLPGSGTLLLPALLTHMRPTPALP